MSGRDPHASHRAASPLELFFDLVFVTAFAQASTEFAHMVAEGYYVDGMLAFGFTMFAVIWAWINFTWFASAFDTDDWVYRLVTMVQMIGVLILALGIHPVFTSIHAGEPIDNGVMVVGYVIMRLAMVFQWLRAARGDEVHRSAALTYALAVCIAQVGWVMLVLAKPSLEVWIASVIALYLVETVGPVLAERKTPTPWHPHHIAERYALLTIIALGESITGTYFAIQAVIESQGWSWEAAVVGFSGVALALGLWWAYFMMPSGEILHLQRRKAFPWGYGHMLIFAAITATGAGLHVAAYYIEHVAHIGAVPVVLSVVIPVAIFTLAIYLLYSYLLGRVDRFHYALLAGTAVVLLLAVLLAAAGVSVPVCLLVVMMAPMVSVVGYELLGHEHHEAALAELRRSVPDAHGA